MRLLPAFACAALVLASAPASAVTVQETFQQGVSEYRNAASPADYARAAETFRALDETWGAGSPEVLLNLGTAQFLSNGAGTGDRTGEAMLNLHRAIKSAPESLAAGLAAKNLESIRHGLNEKHSAKGGTGFVFAAYNDGWTALFSWIPAGPAVAVFLAFWTCLFGLLAARRMMPRRIVLILLASFAVLTAAAGVCAGGSARILGYSTGVIIEDAPIYDQFQSVEPAGELPEGLEFRVLRHRDQRIEIRLSSGRIGWVPEDRAGLP